MDENRSAVYDEPDLELTTISSLIGIIAKKIVILTQYMILAAMPLEVSSLLEGRGGGRIDHPAFNCRFKKKKNWVGMSFLF